MKIRLISADQTRWSLQWHCCADVNWDEWQPPAHDQQTGAEYSEQQMEGYEPYCDDPDFIVCSLFELTTLVSYTTVWEMPFIRLESTVKLQWQSTEKFKLNVYLLFYSQCHHVFYGCFGWAHGSVVIMLPFAARTSVSIGDGARLELVDKFCYLIDMLNVNGHADAAVKARAWKRWNRFGQLVPLLTIKIVWREVILYIISVHSCMLYGSETWPPKKKENKTALRPAEMIIIRWRCDV